MVMVLFITRMHEGARGCIQVEILEQKKEGLGRSIRLLGTK